MYRGIPDKYLLPGKHQCTAFHGVNVAARLLYTIYIRVSAHVGQNHELCLHERSWVLTWDTTVHLELVEGGGERGVLYFMHPD